ncbi:MAG: hypothetical protein QF570_15925 [Myxococcota bacterium]|jgi:hypothetical protein|nr:hypothetical protein [Myxococcota bacterium]
MATIRKHAERYEIRECRNTKDGPRQYTLAGFSGLLTPETLDRAEARAQRPFDRERLIEKARSLDIPVTHRRRFPEARALLASLQSGARLEPGLVDLLQRALEPLSREPLPEHLEDANLWIGQAEWERGRALRGLLRSADRVLASRPALRARDSARFPRFASRDVEAAEAAETA